MGAGGNENPEVAPQSHQHIWRMKMITWTLEPSNLGPSFELLRVRCSVHPWSYASHEHARAADAARDHELLYHPKS